MISQCILIYPSFKWMKDGCEGMKPLLRQKKVSVWFCPMNHTVHYATMSDPTIRDAHLLIGCHPSECSVEAIVRHHCDRFQYSESVEDSAMSQEEKL